MGKRSRWGQRPEASGSAAEHYGEDAERYHGTNATLQRELADRALQMLALQERTGLLLDIGCGSGLSGACLSDSGHAWVGLDISAAMLALAQAAPASHGHVCLSDMAQGLPLRPACADGAVSVSAVQWLCAHARPQAAMARLYSTLHACLRPGARAALQVYLEDGQQVTEMLSAARAAGFAATFCVDYPHPTPAKKFYINLHKRAAAAHACGSAGSQRAQALAQAQAPGVQTVVAQDGLGLGDGGQERPCCLAWPASGTCGLSWERCLRHAGLPTDGLVSAVQRLQARHAAAGKHVLRLHRRAESNLFARSETNPRTQAAVEEPGERGDAGSQGGGGGHGALAPLAAQAGTPTPPAAADGTGGGSGGGPLVVVEAHVVSEALQACGGAVFVQVTLGPEQLEATAAALQLGGAAIAGTPPCPATAESGLEVAGGILATALLGPGARLLACKVAIVEGEAAEKHMRPALRPYPQRQPTGGEQCNGVGVGATGRPRPYMWIEPLALQSAAEGATLVEAGSLDAPGPDCGAGHKDKDKHPLHLAILHAQKSPQHIILSKSYPSFAGAAAASHNWLAGLCVALDAGVVAADVIVRANSMVDVTWLLFISGLEERVRSGQLVRHLRGLPI